uniref:Uncharacterized protein n=1 Tax=Arundo donax TaxID=35708 RepID=A0A0A9DAZ3_ARUDO
MKAFFCVRHLGYEHINQILVSFFLRKEASIFTVASCHFETLKVGSGVVAQKKKVRLSTKLYCLCLFAQNAFSCLLQFVFMNASHLNLSLVKF